MTNERVDFALPPPPEELKRYSPEDYGAFPSGSSDTNSAKAPP